MRSVHAALALVALAMLTPVSSAWAANDQIVVGNNPQTCKNAQYSTISAAVAAASPGATIAVCPGTYAEHVYVNKPLTLLGARHGTNAAATKADAVADPRKESIVANDGYGGIDVLANDVTIDGFTVQGTLPPTGSYPDAGIWLHPGSDRSVVSNVLRGNGLGVYVENDQAGLTVERNAFIGNAQPNNPGAPAGGLFACCNGPITDASISRNLFTHDDLTEFSINVASSSQGLVIDHNVLDTESSIVIGRATDAKITYNHGVRIYGTGVYVFGETDGLLIEHNNLAGIGPSELDAGGTGIATTVNFGATLPNTNAVIAHNELRNFTYDGISLGGLVSSLVSDNHATDSGRDGINIRDNSSNNEVAKNELKDSGRNGIRGYAGSSANTIEQNMASGSAMQDCYDASMANTWLNNKGKTQNRPGLCKNATVVGP